MNILERVRADLSGATLAKQQDVAKACGIPWATLRKIVDGDTNEPRYSTVERLRAYYLSPAERGTTADPVPQQAAVMAARREQMGG